MTTDSRFEPKLKPGRRIPFEYVRQCDRCRKNSLFVNFSGDLSLICRNPFCKALNAKTYIPCILQHRDHELERFSMVLDEEIAIFDTSPKTPELEKGTPDVENDVFSPSMNAGPYKDCNGVLVWDDHARPAMDCWVLCNVCRLSYHICIMAGYSSISGESVQHSNYRILQDANGNKRVSSNRQEWDKFSRKFRLRNDVLMTVEEIRFERSRKVTEAVKIIGIDY